MPASMVAFSAFALMTSLKTFAAESEEVALRIGDGNHLIGKQKANEERCTECHGAEGISSDERIPNHAGQYAGYLAKQLHEFRSAERKSEIMNIMAEDLSDGDIADIAAYFASQPVMQGEGGQEGFNEAEQLFSFGKKARNIPACVSCHGQKGKGAFKEGVYYPVLGGQRKVYLRSQLVNWKLEVRTNSPKAIMNEIAKQLSDDEIESLSNYLSRL